ncbi:TNF receptor-associated factor 4-like [Ixodes scapularis]|uniref:TNF receptor-associated factor 4-like n=1 Tax=Ixodes scapularis TaxID=6945 RepID=UPI001A9FB3E0|nr:TNF receptor-associated factor 4-like [Ixodes scapularis]
MRPIFISGFSDTLDWRPLYFEESSAAHNACSLCGLVSRNVLRLPCEHTLCLECHEESQRRGSTCPLDEEPFDDDNIVHLDISGGYMLKRTVACVNAPNGCDFIGQASRLVDHYKQCSFHVVPCPRCQSPVLRTELVGHCKGGCSSASTTPVPIPYYINVNYDHLEITSSELKREMFKISENLSFLQTSLNQWLEEVRTLDNNTSKELKDATLKISDHLSGLNSSLEQSREDGREAARNTKEQLESQSSRLSEQLDRIETKSFAAANKELKAAIEDTMKTHVAQELRAQSEELMNGLSEYVLRYCGPMKFHWYFQGWEDLKKSALDAPNNAFSPLQYVFGYNVGIFIRLRKEEGQMTLGLYMRIHPGVNDSKLEWPFSKTYTLGVIHPKDKAKRKIHQVDTSKHLDEASLQMPKQGGNLGLGKMNLSTANVLEAEGFVNDDALHCFLQVEPYCCFFSID